jgi:hypothetical protein
MLYRILPALLLLATVSFLAPRAVYAQSEPGCAVPVVEFQEWVVDEAGRPILDEDGRPHWQPATGVGADGLDRHLTSAYFRPSVRASFSELNDQPQVEFELTDEGSSLMRQITERNRGRPLAIFVDGLMIVAPIVQAVITDQGRITGVGLEEAQDIAGRINAALIACPTPP